jgi:cytochrome c oxidase subunit 4
MSKAAEPGASEAAVKAGLWPLWRRNLLIWAALLVLLGLTFWLSYVPLGNFNVVAALGIAAAKASLVGLLFMNLSQSRALIRLAAAAGFFWLVIMFGLTLADFLTRLWTG